MRCEREKGLVTRASDTAEERFWAKVEKSDGCWLWLGGLNPAGYGRFGVDGVTVYAHRFAYELLVGPIPEGLTIDHVKERGCTSRACVNPDHLEAVTQGENTRRRPSHGGSCSHKPSRNNTLVQVSAAGRRKRICLECNPRLLRLVASVEARVGNAGET